MTPMSDQTDDAAIRLILEGTAQETGQAFFKALVQRLAQVLGTTGAFVTEFDDERQHLTALAFWLETDFVPHYEYDVAGTPCGTVIQSRQLFHVVDQLTVLFPDDTDLQSMRAVSYLGMPLLDKDSRILGHLAVIDSKPMLKEQRTENLFRIFAARASAELQRIHAENQTRESETKLSLLVDSAMDAIIDIDERLRIIRVNPSGAKVFRRPAERLIGLPFTSLLTTDNAEKVVRLTQQLASRNQSAGNYSWVAGGFQIRVDEEQSFPAEGSLSHYFLDGRSFFAIILRDIRDQIEAAHKIAALTSEREYLREELNSFEGFDNMIGKSEPWTRVLEQIRQVAESDACVLITGETGTGKEVIARAIHAASQRKHAPLIKVNCAAIPESLIESEFFGHEKGAFTGATAKRNGRFALADGGTMFLDEVGEIPVELQSKLLRVLQEGEFEPVGSSTTQKVDVRVIAATNRVLKNAIREGKFREDLYYRINVFPIELPPLRERGDDVILLAAKFATVAAQKMGRLILPLTSESKRRLKEYDWPGNVRELQNVMERAVITSRSGLLDLEACLPHSQSHNAEPIPALSSEEILTAAEMENLERQNIIHALTRCEWRISGPQGAATLLGLPPTTLSSRIKALKIRRPE
jgi:PAS domain S-box-containing protein